MKELNWPAIRQQYFDHLESPDVRSATGLVERLIIGGQSAATVVREVLRPAQIEVGHRWQTNGWTVADEHAASAVTEAALMTISAVGQRPVETTGAGTVVLACSPGEWHSLPLRMVSEVLTEAGFMCYFLGASVPQSHLRAYLDKVRPVMLGINCSSALTLDGAVASIAAAHSVGTPVLAGGRGFGPDHHRASLAGADAWTDDATAAVDILLRWRGEPLIPRLPLETGPGGQPATAEELAAVRTQTVAELLGEFAQMASYTDEQWARTHEDIDYIVAFAVAAVRFRDDRIFSEFAGWLGEVLAARRVPLIVLSASFVAIANALAATRPQASTVIRAAA